MITFGNPQEKVYDLENLNDKIIMMHIISSGNDKYIAFVHKKEEDCYVFKGNRLTVSKHHCPIVIFGYSGKTVLDLLTNTYNTLLSFTQNIYIKFYVIENMVDLKVAIDECYGQ